MPFAQKVVLHCPQGMPVGMAELATQQVAKGVRFVAAVGPACQAIEDLIDEAAVAAGSPEQNFVLTTSHPDESLAEVIAFAESLSDGYEGPVQVVEIRA